MKKISIGIALFVSLLPSWMEAQYLVREMGAKGDGVSLDTRAIQEAIDKAYAHKGGVVIFSAGTYKIGTLILKDNIELHLQPGAVLLGSSDYRDYTAVSQQYQSRTRNLYAKYFMIFAEGASNISITGSGTIHGNGLDHFQEVRPQNLRPNMIRLVNCSQVKIRDVQLLESANWTLHLLGCRDVLVSGITIENHGEGNRDGLDIDGCLRVKVSDSRFSTTDDAIVLKATSDTLCRDIAITNCLLSSHGSAIKTGTESNGGFRNITVSNCIIRDVPVHAGIELITVDGGIMENILLENIAMEHVATPIFIRLGLRVRPFKEGQYVQAVGDVGNISLENISVQDARLPSSIMGLPNKPLKNITISNYTVSYTHSQEAVPYNKVPFEEFAYPMAIMFKNLPAYGLYCRNVEGLNLHHLTFSSTPDEMRSPLAFDRVRNLKLITVSALVENSATPLAHIRNVHTARLAFCSATGSGKVLFEVEKGNCDGLGFTGNGLGPGQKELAEVEALPDERIFEDFKTEIQYSYDKGVMQQGLYACELSRDPLRITLDMTKKGSLQLCLLVKGHSRRPVRVRIEYEGISQEFVVDWDQWGWAPITLLKEYAQPKKVAFTISAAQPDSALEISKVYVRYQDTAKTD